MSAIVDIQCVLGADNKYMIKEMSVVDTESWACQHWIFKNSISKQDNKSRRTNKWLKRSIIRGFLTAAVSASVVIKG